MESWTGIYVGDQKIGYSLSRSAPRSDGGQVLKDRTKLRPVLLGEPNDITLATDVVIAADGQVERLVAQLTTEVRKIPVSLRIEGLRRGEGMELTIFQGGRELSTVVFDDVPATPSTIYPSVAARSPAVGDRLVVPYFSPLSRGRAEAQVTVIGRERALLPEGEEVEAYRLRVDHSGKILEALIDLEGRRISEEEVDGGFGMRLVLETEEQARERGWPEGEEEPLDLIALSSIPVDRPLPGGGRSLRELTLRVDGSETTRSLLSRFHEGRWDPATGELHVEVPDPEEAPSYPLPSQERGLEPWLQSSAFLPADDPAIQRQAGRILGDAIDARTAARKLERWVHSSLTKVPVAGVPQATEILESLRGDCNEHTTLYTALARSVGLPTRMAAGIVYSESIFADGAFYYHAWPEVWLGDGWVPVDPTFGQFPADATHVKLVEGELDRQMEIMGVIGQLQLEVVSAGAP